MSTDPILGPDFHHTGASAISLNETQQKTVSKVESKVASGEYEFESPPCPVCGESSEFTRLSNQDRYGLYHPVSMCETCGLVQPRPRMTEQSYGAFYADEYRLLYDGKVEWESSQFAGQYERASGFLEYILEVAVDDLSDAKVLDIGSGPGGMASYFQDQGHPVIGCDLDEDAVEYAKSNDVPVRYGPIKQIELPWAPDVVVLSHVVEHFLDPVTTLKTIRDIGHEDTYYFIEVPGVKSIRADRSYYGGTFRKQLQNAHTLYFTKKTLRNVMGSAGFESLDIRHAPALERSDEFGHIRGLFQPRDTADTFEWESDYAATLDHLRQLELDEQATSTD